MSLIKLGSSTLNNCKKTNLERTLIYKLSCRTRRKSYQTQLVLHSRLDSVAVAILLISLTPVKVGYQIFDFQPEKAVAIRINSSARTGQQFYCWMKAEQG